MARAFTSTDRVSVASVTPTTQVSICAWVRSPNTASFPRILTVNDKITFNLDGATNRLRFERQWSGGNATWDTVELTWGVDWHHVALTYDGSSVSNDPIFSFDRVAQTLNNNGTPSGTIDNTAGALYLGNRVSDAARPLEGDLAWVGLHDVVLTAGEITEAAWRGWTPRGLIGLWPLWGADSPEPDLSGTGKNGTVTGTTRVSDPPVLPTLYVVTRDLRPTAQAAGGVAHEGAAAITATGALAGVSALAANAAGVLDATGAVAGVAALAADAAASVVATGTLAGLGGLALDGAGALTTTAVLDGTGLVTLDAAASIVATGSLAGVSALAAQASGLAAGSGNVAGSAALAADAAASVTTSANLVALGGLALDGAGALATLAILVGEGLVTLDAAASIVATGSLAGVAALAAQASGLAAGSGNVAGSAVLAANAAASAVATGTLAGLGGLSLLGAGALTTTAVLDGTGLVTLDAA
ncbi:MAG TPA: LamG-like jellyroll fold domain-containing protein, partial [Nitriliruptorales bacterium]